MIDVFLSTNTAIADVGSALSGFDSNVILVRNGGATECWQRKGSTYEQAPVQMTTYEDLDPVFVEFHAFLSDPRRAMTAQVTGSESLRLSEVDAAEWLLAVERHRYAIEDAIGCSINVNTGEATHICASAHFGVSEFKSMIPEGTAATERLFEYARYALAAGADEISITIAIKRRR